MLQSKVTIEMQEAGLVREFVKHHWNKDFSSARLAIDIGKTSISTSYNDSFSHHNPTETNAILAVCRDLIGRSVRPGAIWILTPYSGQSQYIEGLVNAEILLEGVRVNIITQSQRVRRQSCSCPLSGQHQRIRTRNFWNGSPTDQGCA